MFYDDKHGGTALHIHLDPLGGIAGDMFIAAMSNAFPEVKLRIERVIAEANLACVSIAFTTKNDGVLVGTHFQVRNSEHVDSQDHDSSHEHVYAHSLDHSHEDAAHSHPHEHAHEHPHSPDHSHAPEEKPVYENQYAVARNHGHAHRSYKEIRQLLTEAKLPEGVRAHSLNIFRIIGEAEAEVHGVPVDVVSFHEVGGWDSVVDVIGAACAIDYLNGATWSCSSIPKGGGFIRTAHGELPVPPPAVALLLRGFVFHDDGVLGERVTPTGAAILKYLQPSAKLPMSLELKDVGHGFGTKKFPSLSNVLRVLSFARSPVAQQSVAVLNFEIDDMTGEELSISLDNLRATDGVLDVIQSSAYGKKNRVTMSIQVLASVEVHEHIINKILSTTTTLGVRHQITSRTILQREIRPVNIGDNQVRVKVADRPGGAKTAKVDIDDLNAASSNCYDMRKLASAAENNVLKESDDEHN
ncbi:MAG: LarC family nickel insertion protein [Cyanobacteria bacterium SZAS-4]|nr:LarC family nickel insertion protein [Cyanobacteria bacterium SZAS-4]